MKFLFLSFALMVSEVAVHANHSEVARIGATRADLYGGIKTALDAFAVDCGRYPTTSEGFKALLICPTNIPVGKWRGPYFDPPNIPVDPWGNEYVYRFPGVHNKNSYDLYSCGFDGISKSGGDDLDDINNWDPTSPHGGTGYYGSYSDQLIDKFADSLAFPVFLLTLLFISFLGWVWMTAALFSRRVRVSITRHKIALIIWFVASLAAILLLLCIPRICG
jgi:general secretion pathway protein G